MLTLPQLVSPSPTQARTLKDPFYQKMEESAIVPPHVMKYVPLVMLGLVIYFVFFHKKRKRK